MTFSVIVPTFNRIALLKKTLENLFRQNYPDYSVIVVNDGSTDETDEYLSRLALDGFICYLKQPNQGPAAARNAGIHKAQGDYLALTDDDCLVPQDWLQRFAKIFNARRVDIVGGAVRNCVQKNIYSEVSQEMSNHFVTVLAKGDRSTMFLTSNNIAYRADIVRKAGGFDERFRWAGGEERALNYKIIHNGGISAFVPDIVVEHYHELSARKFFRQQNHYGRGAFVLHRIIGRELNGSLQSIPLEVYATLAISFIKSNPLRGFIKIVLFLWAQVNVVFGFFTQAFIPMDRKTSGRNR
jgi:glycosyltransferase involved in cell wall biosynthesis